MPPSDEGVRSASASAGTAGGRLGREMPVERRVASGRGGGGRDAHTEGESWLGAEGEAMPMRWDWRRRRAAVVVVLIREWGDSGGRFERGTETVTPLPDGGGILTAVENPSLFASSVRWLVAGPGWCVRLSCHRRRLRSLVLAAVDGDDGGGFLASLIATSSFYFYFFLLSWPRFSIHIY
jgi:hypothetical protein